MLLAVALPALAQTTIIYSRADTAQAVKAQRLVRMFDLVVIDRDIPAGVPWRQVIELAICKSDRVLLLWSRRAAASAEVAREIQTARLCGVPVVPVLLDSTPLPADVGQLQGVDWR